MRRKFQTVHQDPTMSEESETLECYRAEEAVAATISNVSTCQNVEEKLPRLLNHKHYKYLYIYIYLDKKRIGGKELGQQPNQQLRQT